MKHKKRKQSLLLIDDSTTVHSIVKALFLDSYHIIIAKDGESGLALARQHEPDLILLDVIMPGIDGFETLARLKTDKHTANIPTLFLTSDTDPTSEIRGLELGAADYVRKPITPPILIARVKTQLALQKSLSDLQRQHSDLLKSTKQLEKERNRRKTANTKLRAIFDGGDIGIALIEQDMMITEHNQMFAQLCWGGAKYANKNVSHNAKAPVAHIETLAKKVFSTKENFQEVVHTFTMGKQERTLCFNGMYIPHPENSPSLLITVKDQTQLNKFEKMFKERQGHMQIVGRSEKMQGVYSMLERIQDVDSSVLLMGESGTGKELAAHAIHLGSRRADQPFITVHCAALSESLLESELFGHAKGAFSGAISSRIGRFEMANNGTLFLDEIGEISPVVQVKLLRFLENFEFERVGESIPRKADVRIVAATNANLKQMISDGSFRNDLFYRLNSIRLELPPLSKREGDIPLLVEHFLSKIAHEGRASKKITTNAMRYLLNYSWPGNIRELRNAIDYAHMMSDSAFIKAEHLPQEIFATRPPTQGKGRTNKGVTKTDVIAAIKAAGGRKVEAAKALSISRATLYRKIAEYNIGRLDLSS